MHIVDSELRPLAVKIYEAIREAWVDYGESPSQAELSRACQCSTTAVIDAIKVLRSKGYIHAPRFQVRSLKPTDIERTISREPIDPWAELAPPKKYFVRRIEK